MILLVLSLLLLPIFLYNQRIFIYSLVIYFVAFDMMDGFYEEQKLLAAIRYLVPLFLLLILAIQRSAFKSSDSVLFLLAIYLVLLFIFIHGELAVSARNLLAVFVTFMMIPAGRYLGSTEDFISSFQPYNRMLLVTVPIYIILANVFHFGESYSEAFTTGYLITSRMYVVPIVVFLAVYYLLSGKANSRLIKSVDAVFILINISILIVNTRRTTLAMLMMALIIYAFFNRKVAMRMAALTLFAIAMLAVSYPLYEKPLQAQLEKRERISSLDTYEEEGRYLETQYILAHHSRNQQFSELLFGIQLFDSYDFGTRYFGRDRPIHSDLNMLFFSTGLVGVAWFGFFFWHYFFRGARRISAESKMVYYPLLAMFLIVLIPGRFIGTMTYAPLLMLLLSAVKAQGLRITNSDVSYSQQIKPPTIPIVQ